jgi:hypothetical protein
MVAIPKRTDGNNPNLHLARTFDEIDGEIFLFFWSTFPYRK